MHQTHTTWFSSAIVHVFFEAKQLSQVWLQANVPSGFLVNRSGESSSVSYPSKLLIPHPNLGSVGWCRGDQSGLFSFFLHFPFTVDCNGPLHFCESGCSLIFSKSTNSCGGARKFRWYQSNCSFVVPGVWSKTPDSLASFFFWSGRCLFWLSVLEYSVCVFLFPLCPPQHKLVCHFRVCVG